MTKPAKRERTGANGNRRRRVVLAGVGLGVSVGLGVWALRGVAWTSVGQVLLGLRARYLALALGTKFLGLVCLGMRLRALTRAGGDLSGRHAVEAAILGVSANVLVPLRGGEIVRIGILTRWFGIEGGIAVAVTVVERMLDVGALAILMIGVGFVAGSLGHVLDGGPWLGAVALSLVLGGLLILYWIASRPEEGIVEEGAAGTAARWRRWLANIRLAVGMVRSRRAMVAALGWTTGFWCCSLSTVGLTLQACSVDAAWFAGLVVLLFVNVGGLLPSAPASVGSYHFFASKALTVLGVPGAVAVGFALVMHFVAMVPFTVVGLILASRRMMQPLWGLRLGEWMDGEAPVAEPEND